MLAKIYIYGEPILRKRLKPVKKITEEERSLFAQMLKKMYESGGVGLAANQVGVDKQLCVVAVDDKVLKLADPKILKKKGCEFFEEGCLSLPEVSVNVRRAKEILCRALNENNETVEFQASGFLARAIQHEVDHLMGRLIIDYAPLWKRVYLRRKLNRLKKENPARNQSK